MPTLTKRQVKDVLRKKPKREKQLSEKERTFVDSLRDKLEWIREEYRFSARFPNRAPWIKWANVRMRELEEELSIYQ